MHTGDGAQMIPRLRSFSDPLQVRQGLGLFGQGVGLQRYSFGFWVFGAGFGVLEPRSPETWSRFRGPVVVACC